MTRTADVLAAYDAGRLAAEQRRPASNPYRTAEGATRAPARSLAIAWRAGFRRITAALPVDYAT
ncbi:hypothetical protein SAMN04488074_109214 [Lentzea albidocapillata subsp. violacea]|uniref:Uncharacterized protein n=1 Tax=Lentzea albidocapillata subsp. violacea TaxID=128104 RepID=A0A1G9HZC0_9PSEU|nr:hypothetical protein [Lentzea albidocapillata]SDL18202.1 hypothetical protein SAMN04488074_109214 [Lentzea albidocapillata subsp. violacea]